MTELEQFEQAVYREQFDAATAMLHRILANFEQYGGDAEQSARSWFYWRFAGAISALLLNRRYRPSLEVYQLLIGSQPSLMAVFACTPLGNPDHIISLLADIRDLRNLRFADEAVLRKCLLCYTLDSEYDLDLEQIAERFPELAAPLILAQLSCDLNSKSRILERVNRLLEHDWVFLDRVTPALPTLLTVSSATMNCSYATVRSKHRIKRHINAMVRNWAQARGIAVEQTPQRPLRNGRRPRVVIPLESFQTTHAMYRCFYRSISSLKDTFEVIAITPEHCIDTGAEAVFDRVIRFDASELASDPAALVKRVADCEPDLVYYPSLGMANYTLLLANLRLAPLQCFTLGHPATSHCDEIDVVLVQEQDFTTDEVFSETVVLTANDTSPTIDRVREYIPEPRVRERPEIIRIAVTSKHMKINHDFLACCRSIADRAAREVEFHFFPGTTGFLYEFVAHEIGRILPGSIVYPTTDFEAYIHNLDRCDVRLGTFPFGGANTNMDCFGLGIPFVVMRGDQPHAQSDCAQLLRAGMPEWLMTRDIDEYIAAALRLIDDDETRMALSRDMLALDQREFFHPRHNRIRFGRTLLWLWRNHERVRDSGRRVWTLADQGPA